MRRSIALAVVVIHGAVLLLCLLGKPLRLAREPDGPYFVSLWIPPDRPAKPVGESPAPLRKALRIVPDESISSAPSPDAPVTPPAPGIEAAPVPQVDWANEGKLAAEREAGRNPAAGKDFSPAPKPIKPPCIPKKSSMEWNGKEDRRVGFASGLPFVRLGKRCVVGLGFFACNPGELPEVNGHLLDDMKDPERATSSVPDPNVCD